MTKEKIAIMQAYLDGKPLEILIQGKWVPVELEPIWDWAMFDYRIAEIDDSIDWSNVNPNFKWMARDQNGLGFLFVNEPNLSFAMWYSGGLIIEADNFSSYRKGTKDWKDSLVRRPE